MIELLDYRKSPSRLRKPGQVVSDDLLRDPNFPIYLEQMKTILAKDGVGLAAPQVGWSIQLFMLCINSQGEQVSDPNIFLNPKIISSSKDSNEMEEGCLSFPNFFLKVTRPAEVTWQYETLTEGSLRLSGEKHTTTSTGFYATAVQHEIDHLNGKLLIDYASTVQKLKIKKWLKS